MPVYSLIRLVKLKRYLPLLLVHSIPIIAYIIFKMITNPVPAFNETSLTSDYQFSARNDTYLVNIAQKKSNYPLVQFKLPNSKSIQFEYVRTKGNESKINIEKKNREILFKNVEKDMDIQYIPLEYGLKENLILRSKPKANYFFFKLNSNNLSIKKTYKDSATVAFYEDDEYLFHIDSLYAQDAKGARTENVMASLVQQGENQYIRVLVDKDWLLSKKRVYPITIDPTIVHDTTSEFSTGVFNRVREIGSGSSPQLVTYYQEMTADPNTVALWHLNELSGNVLDSSGNGNTLTPTGTTVNTTTQILGDAARTFNGTSDRITSTSLDFSKSSDKPFYMSAWINTNSLAEHQPILGKTTANYEWNFEVNTSGVVLFMYYTTSGNHGTFVNGTATYASGPFKIATNTWYHVAVSYNGSTGNVYINGIPGATFTGSGTWQNRATYVSIGHSGYELNTGLVKYFAGSIDEVYISNTARSAEDIKRDAQRRPYSVYTSEVLDLTLTAAIWNPLTWSETGVSTGNGETLEDETNLIALWNFNETSGTNATNSAGSCSTSCTGTLSGFNSTASQDADYISGWTTNNKRWGTGALMFDDTDSAITIPDNDTLSFTTGTEDNPISISTWVNPRTVASTGDGNWIVSKRGGTTEEYQLEFWEGKIGIAFFDSTSANYISRFTTKVWKPGEWYNIVATYDGATGLSGIKIYVNGVLEATTPSNAGTYSYMKNGTSPVTIGMPSWNTAFAFNGTIDSTAIFGRVLDANEILSNYNTGNIELQTRVGDDTTPHDGSWEAWKPSTVETQLLSENTHLTDSLISYWKLDEASGTRYDSWGTNNLSDNNTVLQGIGKMNGTADFEMDNSEFLKVTDNPSLSPGDIDFTISAWVNLESIGANQMIYSKSGSDASQREIILDFTGTYFDFLTYNSSGNPACSATSTNIGTVNTGTWYHIVAWHDATANTCNIQVNNGTANSGNESAIPFDNTGDVRIGGYSQPEAYFFDGKIDEVGFWKRKLTTDEKTLLYSSGSPTYYPDGTDLNNLQQTGGLNTTTDSLLKLESTGSQKIETGRVKADGSTVALWHLDETGGTGAYIKDASSNSNNGTPTGTTSAKGQSGKARAFSGSSEYITFPESSSLAVIPQTTGLTIELWMKLAVTPPTDEMILCTAADGYCLFLPTASTIRLSDNNGHYFQGTYTFQVGQWYHVAATVNSGATPTETYYVNGVAVSSGASTTWTSTTGWGSLYLGHLPTNADFNGSIDEVRISNTVRSAEEIAEAYRMGQDHYINKPIATSDLSTSTSLPFYIAADRPGSYLEATVGESAYSNYQPDANTLGLWHLNEPSGSGAYLKDSSIYTSAGTPTGAVSVQGKIGKGRYFDGTDDYINLGSPPALEFSGSFTISAWYNVTGNSADAMVIYKRGGAEATRSIEIQTNDTYTSLVTLTATGFASSSVTFPSSINQWHYVTAQYDGTYQYLYIDGVLVDKDAQAGPILNNTTNNSIGMFDEFNAGRDLEFKGMIDEVRIDNVVRTQEEIRQAYEVGSRSHMITIDFGAKLDTGNLITDSSDLSFTVDSTFFGFSKKGSNIYVGDKIIVKENYNGVEYIAQGNVTAVTTSTGAITISGWDTGSTFPATGFSIAASVFKWQREFFPLNNIISSHLNNATLLSFRMTNGESGRTIWLDDLKSSTGYLSIPTGSSIPSSAGHRYAQYSATLSSKDTLVSPTLSAVTLDWSNNNVPDIPQLDSPADKAYGSILRPVLRTTGSDADLDNLKYKIVLCEDSQMILGCQVFDQSTSQTGWSGQDGDIGTTYLSGSQATYTLQTDLAKGRTYYWKSYAIDPNGSQSWSLTQSIPRSLTTNTTPRASAVQEVENYIARRESSHSTGTQGWTSIPGAVQSGTTASSNGWIDGSNFHVGQRYLIMAWGEFISDAQYTQAGLRVKHGNTPFTESQAIEENTALTLTSNKTSYHWFTVWTASNEDLEVEMYRNTLYGSLTYAEDITLVAINAEELIDNGALIYNINTLGGGLDTTFTSKASISWTPTEDNLTWWINSYSKADIVDINSDIYEARVNINGTPNIEQKLIGLNASDTPLYGIGAVKELDNTTNTASLEIRQSGSTEGWYSAGIFALNLEFFDSSFASAISGNGSSMSTPGGWVEQINSDSFNNFTHNYLVAGGALVSDNGARVIARIQENDTNITDDVGVWRRGVGENAPLNLADIRSGLTNGVKNFDFDAQTTVTGTANLIDTWIVGLSFEESGQGPTIIDPTNGETNQSLRPQLKLSASDADLDTLKYKIQLCTNSAMTLNCQTFDQTLSQTGWSGQNANSFTRYQSGSEATYTLQSDLVVNSTYYWRGYAIDPDGLNLFSPASSIYSFTTTLNPLAPTDLHAEQTTAPNRVTDLTPELSAIHHDPQGDSATNYRIQVNTQPDFLGTILWNSSKLVMTTTANGARSPEIAYNGSALSFNGITYYWRIKFWDSKGAEGEWSEASTFTMDYLKSPLGCLLVDTSPNDTSITIKWNDTNDVEDGYRIQRKVNSGSFTDLYTTTANTTEYTDTTTSTGNVYTYRIYSKYLTSLSTIACTTSPANLNGGHLIIEGIIFK